MTLLGLCLGCSPLAFFLPQKPVYVPPGVLVEVAKDTRVECWITNKDTGVRERRIVDIQGGWMIMRPRTDFDRGPAPEVVPQAAPQPEAEVLPQKFARAR
jgi:hypothetical protein